MVNVEKQLVILLFYFYFCCLPFCMRFFWGSRTESIVCSRAPCERHRQAVSICFEMKWVAFHWVSLRFHVFRGRLGSIWFHHATSTFFTQWMVFTQSIFIVFHRLDFSWTFRPGGAGLGFPAHSWHWLLTPQKSYGLRRNTVLTILRLSWKGKYGFGFQDVSGTFTIPSVFMLIMFFTISQRYRIARLYQFKVASFFSPRHVVQVRVVKWDNCGPSAVVLSFIFILHSLSSIIRLPS